MHREAVSDVLERLVGDVLPIHAQYQRDDLSLGDFEHQVELLIDDYADQFLEIEMNCRVPLT